MVFITCFVAIILIMASYTYWRFKDLPPGPYGIPLLGYAVLLGTDIKSRQLKLKKFTEKYGKIYSLNLANERVIVINDWPTITEVLVKQGHIFSGRPYSFAIDFLFERKDIVSAYGPIWKEQKNFCMKILQQLGMNKSSMDTVIVEEIENFIIELERHDEKPMVMTRHTCFIPILNTIWALVSGKPVDVSKSTTKAFQKSAKDIADTGSQAGLLNLFPALRHIAPELTGFINLSKAKEIVYNYIKQEVDTQIENFQEDFRNNFIDCYLAEIKKKNDVVPYNKERLIFNIFVLFVAGADTTSVTLAWAILYMALYPDIQQKVHQEMENVIGENSYIPTTSKSLVPYTEATLLEIQRMASVGPLSYPHSPIKDTIIEGIKIPKGTTVITNLWEIHYNEEYWGDPYTFRPERFLDEAGQLKTFTHLLPFSAGPRSCLGEHFAKAQLFLFFTCFMNRFSFQIIPGQPKPSLEPIGPGLIASPEPFSVMVRRIK